MIRKIFGAALMILLSSSAVHAQEWLSVQVGAGPTPNVIDWYNTGAHLMAGVSAFVPGWPLGIRLDGIVTAARYEYLGILPGEDPSTAEPRMIDRGIEPIMGTSLSIVLRRRSGSFRPYGFVGLGYYHSLWSDLYPPEYDFGPTFGVGILREVAGLDWFVELDGRVFGNTFYDRGSDKAFWPLTLGLQF